MVSSMKSRTEIRSLMSDTDVFGVFSSSFPPCGVTYALNPLKLGTLNRIRGPAAIGPGYLQPA